MNDLSTYDGAMAAVGGRMDPSDPGYSRRPLEQWSPEEMVQRQNKWFQRVTDDRRHIERWALLGTAFLLDQQYVDFVGQGDHARLQQIPAKRGRVRTIEQIIEPAYRSEMARLLRNRPQGTTVPDGTDEADFEAAQAADDLLDHVWRTNEVDRVITQAVSWQIVGGTALVGAHWDEDAIDPEGEQGNFDFRALSPFEFGVPNAREQELKRQPYVMVTKAYALDEIEDRWGVRVTPDHAGSYGSLDHRLAAVLSGGTRSGQQDQDQAVVKETWIKPSSMAPAGAVLITAGKQVLDLQVWPEWCKGRYPFHVVRYTPIPGSFWGKSMLQALIPLQRRHNRSASIVVEIQNLLSQMGVAVPRGSQVRSLLGGRGMMIESPPGATQPVTNITTPPVGDLPFRELEHTRQAVRDIASQHEVTKGFTPPNVRSGTAISMLKEMDDSPSSLPLRDIERAVQGLGRNLLEMVKLHWTEPRVVRVLGVDGEIERRSLLSGDDIGGQYQILEGSAWPYTKAERQAEIMSLHERGLIDGDEALKRLDMGAVRGIREEREIDYREARLENQKFEALQVTILPNGEVGLDGEVPVPEDFQNHMAHIATHLRLMKSPQWRTWSPLKKMALEAHVVGHKAALYGQMAMQPGMTEPAVPPPVEGDPAPVAEPAPQEPML
jgi:hypothetical protein